MAGSITNGLNKLYPVLATVAHALLREAFTRVNATCLAAFSAKPPKRLSTPHGVGHGRPLLWRSNCCIRGRRTSMLWTIFVVLLVLWLLGLVTSYTMGGFIHILLIVAIAVLCIQLITGRRVV
jgi:Family of unknown function (DUF5670)